MKDLVKIKFGNIDLNKLTKPVMALAMQKAEQERKRLEARVKKLENKLLPIEDESEERFRREEAYDKAYCQLEEYDDDPIYTLSRLGIAPSRGNLLLAELSRTYLKVNPKYGIKCIMEAYNEYYDIGRKCAYCRKTIPPSSRKGRTKNYCCDACRQKAYRQRKKHKKQGQ